MYNSRHLQAIGEQQTCWRMPGVSFTEVKRGLERVKCGGFSCYQTDSSYWHRLCGKEKSGEGQSRRNWAPPVTKGAHLRESPTCKVNFFFLALSLLRPPLLPLTSSVVQHTEHLASIWFNHYTQRRWVFLPQCSKLSLCSNRIWLFKNLHSKHANTYIH